MKKGDVVNTIKGTKIVIKVKKDVVVFDDGFAPKDMVTVIKKSGCTYWNFKKK